MIVTEFITRNYDNKEFEVIIKTDSEDLIFMRGLAELNKLIANCCAKMDEEVRE